MTSAVLLTLWAQPSYECCSMNAKTQKCGIKLVYAVNVNKLGTVGRNSQIMTFAQLNTVLFASFLNEDSNNCTTVKYSGMVMTEILDIISSQKNILQRLNWPSSSCKIGTSTSCF